MTTSKEHLIRACGHLGIPCVEDFSLKALNGEIIRCEVFIPQFSHHVGMLVFDSAQSNIFQTYADELIEQGYSGTSWNLNSPETSSFDLDRFIDMFSEWGWCGDADKQPEWMRPYDEGDVSDIEG